MLQPSHVQLPSLRIRGFRGIRALSIPRLGRVTLLAGHNGIGKTTVLDALRVYAATGHPHSLAHIVARGEGVPEATFGDGSRRPPLDFSTLFHATGRSAPAPILIGPTDEPERLRIQLRSETASSSGTEALPTGGATFPPVLDISYGGVEDALYTGQYNEAVAQGTFPPTRPDYSDRPTFPRAVPCESLGPESLTTEDLSRLWDRIALTAHEDRAVSALNVVFEGGVDRVAMLGGGRNDPRGRRIGVSVKWHDRPVSLKSLGDGAVRLFGVAVALANSVGGFLLIDEAENGLHHSVLGSLWQMILHTAHLNGIQVLATTHSWDCVRAFAAASQALPEADGLLLRLEATREGLRAVTYSNEDLAAAAEQGIEVR